MYVVKIRLPWIDKGLLAQVPTIASSYNHTLARYRHYEIPHICDEGWSLLINLKTMTIFTECDVFPQNREQVTFWVKISFWYHCKEHTVSFNMVPKLSSYHTFNSYFLR